MFKKYLEDYYKLKISLKEICEKENVVQSTFYRYLKDNGLLSRRKYYGKINTGIKALDENLKGKYASIVKRCNGRPSYEYKKNYEGKDYMFIYEYVKFCNSQKELLKDMWKVYMNSGKEPRKAISVDRLDNNVGYLKENIEFVTHGFNSWKRNIRPIKVTHENKSRYFLSCEEGSLYYNIRRQSIGDILRGRELYNNSYTVENSTIEEVLKNSNVSNIQDYYNKVFHKP